MFYSNTDVAENDLKFSKTTKRGKREQRGLYPLLFSFHINKTPEECNNFNTNEINTSQYTRVSTMSCTNDQMILSGSEQHLQLAAYSVPNSTKYSVTISINKPKLMNKKSKQLLRLRSN